MKHSLTPEVAMAIQKGERDYAHLLYDMELVREPKTGIVTIDNLSDNQRHGYENLERRLRDAV